MRALLLAGVAFGWAGAAAAAPFTGFAVGSWSNPQAGAANPNSNTTTTNTDATTVASFSFGTPFNQTSLSNLFTFNGTGSGGGGANFSADAEQPFSIGAFSYRNGTTQAGTEATGVRLNIALNLLSPVMNTTTFNYNFTMNITPNTTGDPVLDGDIVTIANGLTTTTFTSGGVAYTLALNGFSTDNGKTYTQQFNSPEGSTANANIYATITSRTLAVPEPASLALLGLGVAAVAARRRRRAG